MLQFFETAAQSVSFELINFNLYTYSPTRAKAAALRFLYHTQLDTYPLALLWRGEQLLAQAATYKTHNRYWLRTPMFTAGFEPAISAMKGRQT
jgi:hypothetical protein